MNIVSIPNEVLFKHAEPVKTVTAKIKALVADMTEALARADNPKGIGLAAPQVGVSLRIFIIKLQLDSPLHVFINPEIVSTSVEFGDKPDLLEGCLSIPEIWGPVRRHRRVRVRYLTLESKTLERSYTGLMATTIEHEMDHLDGMLFTARVIEQQGKLYRMEKDEKSETVFKEIEL